MLTAAQGPTGRSETRYDAVGRATAALPGGLVGLGEGVTSATVGCILGVVQAQARLELVPWCRRKFCNEPAADPSDRDKKRALIGSIVGCVASAVVGAGMGLFIDPIPVAAQWPDDSTRKRIFEIATDVFVGLTGESLAGIVGPDGEWLCEKVAGILDDVNSYWQPMRM
jgi:hypothetical protein